MKASTIAALALLVACTPLPPAESGWKPSPDGDRGPFPQDYESIVRSWYAANLKDPDSAKYERITRPRPEHAIKNQFQREAIYGWSVCATVNAKNSLGAYGGAETQWFLIRDGKVVDAQDASMPIYIGHDVNCDDGP